jgi:predicted flap endonuclease-1-like 5' DNA nuclease
MTLAQLIQANWQIVAIALVIAIVVAIWLFSRTRRSTVRERRPDVLDEGAAPAQRNQALIDAPPAAAVLAPQIMPTASAGTFPGVAEVVARGAQEEIQAARPIEAEAPVEPVSVAPDPVHDHVGEPDDLRRIKGLGPKLVATLHALGITRFAQIAAWSDADLDELDTKLGAFAGRPRRDSWVEQARLLAGGDTAAYEEKFGKL